MLTTPILKDIGLVISLYASVSCATLVVIIVEPFKGENSEPVSPPFKTSSKSPVIRLSPSVGG